MRFLSLFLLFSFGWVQLSWAQGEVSELRYQRTPGLDGKIRLIPHVNPANYEIPIPPTSYNMVWHQPPYQQNIEGLSGIQSWCSFLESEVNRISGQQVSLSDRYCLYYFLLEKARAIQQTKNKQDIINLEAGVWTLLQLSKTYGIVPSVYYPSLQSLPLSDLTVLLSQYESLLQKMVESKNSVPGDGIQAISVLLKKYLGDPPVVTPVKGKSSNPLQYMREILQIIPENYLLMSNFPDLPYWKKPSVENAKNYWKPESWNLPLDYFIASVSGPIQMKYSSLIEISTTEIGFEAPLHFAVFPKFAMPCQGINEDYRGFILGNPRKGEKTQWFHVNGYLKNEDQFWLNLKFHAIEHELKGGGERSLGYLAVQKEYFRAYGRYVLVSKEAISDMLEDFR